MIRPTQPSIAQVPDFLQAGLDKRLSTNTLRRQVVATSSTLKAGLGLDISTHPHIKRFLKGVALINPAVVHRFPNWVLHIVLDGLTGPPFEPFATIPHKELTLKTLFLIVIPSARRVSEIGPLSANPNLFIFHKDRVVLHPDPAFIPKVNTLFHREQDIVLPSFCPHPKHLKEQKWHCLDARRLFGSTWIGLKLSEQQTVFSLDSGVRRRVKKFPLEHWPLG